MEKRNATSIDTNSIKYKWQEEALSIWYQTKKGIIEAVPGSGKTHVGLQLISQNLDKIILVVVPSNVLRQQWQQRIREFTKVIHFDNIVDLPYCDTRSGAVIVEVVNTLIQENSQVILKERPPDYIIYDEVHRYSGKSFSKVITIMTHTQGGKLGLTATMPNKKLRYEDYNLLCSHVGDVVYQYSLEEAKKDEIISPFTITIIRVGLTPEEIDDFEAINRKITVLRQKAKQKIEKSGHKFDIKVTHSPHLPKLYNFEEMHKLRLCFLKRRHLSFKARHKIYNTVLTTEKILQLVPGEQVLIYTMTIDVAEQLVNEFNKKDLTAYTIHSSQTQDENSRILEGIKKKYGNILIAVRSLDEGIDLPQLRFIIILANSKQIRQLLQRVGRSIRYDKSNPEKQAHVIVFEITEDQFDKSVIFKGAEKSYFYQPEQIADFYENLKRLSP